MNLTKAEIMSLSQNKIGPCLKIENLQGLLKVTYADLWKDNELSKY